MFLNHNNQILQIPLHAKNVKFVTLALMQQNAHAIKGTSWILIITANV